MQKAGESLGKLNKNGLREKAKIDSKVGDLADAPPWGQFHKSSPLRHPCHAFTIHKNAPFWSDTDARGRRKGSTLLSDWYHLLPSCPLPSTSTAPGGTCSQDHIGRIATALFPNILSVVLRTAQSKHIATLPLLEWKNKMLVMNQLCKQEKITYAKQCWVGSHRQEVL